jgi:glycosyltransferase involved in cell wall biosynthesis
MKLYYVATTRMPNERAHGIQIAKMCEAFIEQGLDLTLVVPERSGPTTSLQEFYGLRVPVPIVRLPTLDGYRLGSFWYRVSAVTFMVSYLVYLWGKRLAGEQFVLYTVDLDNYSSSLLALVGAPLYSEMHGGKENTPMQRLLFRHARGIIATNPITKRELEERFKFTPARFTVEPNGVEVAAFHPGDKKEAREHLGLPIDARIILYTGRLLDWKGLDILADTAALTASDVRWYIVGGTKEEYLRTTGRMQVPASMHFVGGRPHSEIPLWLAASDALVVLGTRHDTQSYYWTSPMKLFEYLLAARPIVASGTPAIRSIVDETAVLFYEPDDAKSMAARIKEALMGGTRIEAMTEAALRRGQAYAWSARAERIRRFLGA